MSYYGGAVTNAGKNMFASLIAGETITLTKVMVGDGEMPAGVAPKEMTDLVNPMYLGSTNVPTVRDNVVYLTVEYRNDMNGGLQRPFLLREFGIWAKTANFAETLIYYATLGDTPQPVNAFRDNKVDIRKYPISIGLENNEEIKINVNAAGMITCDEADQIMFDTFSRNVNKITFSKIIEDVEIPLSAWVDPERITSETIGDAYTAYAYVDVEGVTKDLYPILNIQKAYHSVAMGCHLCDIVETFDGKIKVWARWIPSGDMKASLALIRNTAWVNGDINIDHGGGSGHIDSGDTTTETGGSSSSGSETGDNTDDGLPEGYDLADENDIDGIF